MKNNEQDLKNLIKEMMKDSAKQDPLYTAGNYWKHYEKNILKQIDSNVLSQFRSWEGGSGVGNIQSFSGGSELKSRSFLKNFHPIDNAFNFIDDSILVRKYNSLINKIIPYVPFFKYFLIRIAEMKVLYKNIYESNVVERYNLIKSLDKRLIKISDSSFGLNDKEIVKIKGNVYTLNFLSQLRIVNHIEKNIKFESINFILELGAGFGLLASTFLKLNNKIKYFIIDIAPTIFFSEYFLSNIGYKVFGYKEFTTSKEIDTKKIFEEYDVICLPCWGMSKLKDFNFDLFINIASIQEMEKEQALNYLSLLKKNPSKHIYLNNLVSGHAKATSDNSFGVKEPTTFDDVKNFLASDFKLITEDADETNYQAIFEKK